MNLRDALLQELANLPGTRSFHVHVLVSSPRKHSNLYPFASPRPKTYLQHILVLLSEQPTPDSPRVFVSAIEASLYHVPSTSSAVLYVSKVDSTGQATSPSPTPALVRAFLTYYVDPSTRPLPATHLWIHLFARAQSQYLFPNSAEFPGKRPLTDVKLCAWWKRQFSLVAQDVAGRTDEGTCIQLSYLLPGLGELEAHHALERVYASVSSVSWTYGHPYGQTQVPLPCCSIGGGEGVPHIGHVVPWFDDDPKARFLDEIAYTTDAEGVRSPERKRPRTSRISQRAEEDVDASSTSSTTDKMLKKVSIEEFWERMSFRQECIAGAMTGFFVMATSCPTPKGAPLAGVVSGQMMKRVLTSLMTGHEFSTRERVVWSTRVLEEAIKGLCDGLKIVSRGDTPEVTTPETPPRGVDKRRVMGDVSPLEPVATMETYEWYIYGTIAVSNPDEPRQVSEGDVKSAITVLTARRKKRGKTLSIN